MITLHRPLPDGPTSSADDTLTRLLDGNRRVQTRGVRRGAFARGPDPDPTSPMAAVLACADTPAPPSLLFDQDSGDLFTVRVPGPTVTPETVADLEYAVHVLRVPLVVVLGHEGCPSLRAAVHRSPAVEEHVRDQVRRLGGSLRTPLPDDVRLVGAVLDVTSLAIRVLGAD